VTRDQWWELAKHIKTAFPKDKSFMHTPESVDIWYNLVYEWEYDICKQAVWDCIQKSNFPPSIAELKDAYDIRRSKHDELNRNIRDIYTEMENYYPECLRDKDRIKTFRNAVKTVSNDKVIVYAKKIQTGVIERVRQAEKGDIDSLPTLSECIRSVVDEFR